MRYTIIATPSPFTGKPEINLPSVFGWEPGKPFILRIPVTGERPVTYFAEGLPDGLILCENVISGTAPCDGDYEILLTVKNRLGTDAKRITLEIHPDSVLLTPLMGFTTWNAFGSDVKQDDLVSIAEKIVSSGISEYGYSYINTDSGWQSPSYGGKFDAILPNDKFPDMRAMTDTIHALGLKCGIYSTPMLHAWGCPEGIDYLAGCTTGERDVRFSSINTGIGVTHKEKNNAEQWADWGFDYLKYDWSPTDPVNAELMRKALRETGRAFGFCATVHAIPGYWEYWSEYCQSYRNGTDSLGFWGNLKEIYRSVFTFLHCPKKGHFQDLDMLDTGTFKTRFMHRDLTEDEMIFAYSLRAFFGSPIQISSTLDPLSEFEMSLYCNEEIIALNQDCAFKGIKIVHGTFEDDFNVFEKETEDGGFAYALFNAGEKNEDYSLSFDTPVALRDPWAKNNLDENKLHRISLPPHTVRILKSPVKAK